MSRTWHDTDLEDYPQLSLAARMCIAAYADAEYFYRTLRSECKWKAEDARDVDDRNWFWSFMPTKIKATQLAHDVGGHAVEVKSIEF